MSSQNLNQCNLDHTFFVAEVVGVETEGKVYLIYLCTSCGEAICKEFKVSNPGSPLRLMREEKKK
jgi:hypothetical protein